MKNIICQRGSSNDAQYFIECAHEIKIAIEHCSRKYTGSGEDNYRGLINFLENAPQLENISSFELLENKFLHRPGIVVSAGPSLNENILYLKGIQDKAVIICVDAVLDLLLKNNIYPHFVTCLERVIHTQYFFNQEENENLPGLITVPIIHPKSLAKYKGNKFILPSVGITLSLLMGEKTKQYKVGLSPASMAYKALEILGCNPIILLGQDLAYPRNSTVTHAKGVHSEITRKAESDLEKRDSHNFIEVTGNDGNPILTNRIYNEMAVFFTSIIHDSKSSCINAIKKESGMHIESATRLDPEIVFSNFFKETFPILEVIQKSDLKRPFLDKDLYESSIGSSIQLLNNLESKLLENSNKYAKVFHDNLPSLDTPSIKEALEKAHGKVYQFILESHKNDVIFTKLLSSFSIYSTSSQLRTYQNICFYEKDFTRRHLAIYEALQIWFKDALFWCQRIKHTLSLHHKNNLKEISDLRISRSEEGL